MRKLDSYVLFEVDENGDEMDILGTFSKLETAKKKGKAFKGHAHIVCVPKVDLDDDPDLMDDWEANVDYEPFECVWNNYEESDHSDEEDSGIDEHF